MTIFKYQNFLCVAVLLFSAWNAFADKMVNVRIVVRNQDGDPVASARVSIWHDWSGIGWSTPLGDWSRPADYQLETNSKGIVSTMIPAKAEFKQQGVGERAFGRTLKIEVYKTGYTRGDDSISFSTVSAEIPDQVIRHITIDGKEPGEIKDDNMVVKVRVSRQDTKETVEGAKVRVYLNTPFLRKEFSAATDRNGDARVVASKYNDFEIVVSKENFIEARKTIVVPKVENEIGPYEIALSRNAGAEITVTVNDVDSNLPVGDAQIIFDGITSIGYYTATTDGGGRATLFIPDIGRFKAKVTQSFYEPLTEEVRILQGEEKKSVAFTLKAKPKKDDGKDTIHVVVKSKDEDDGTPSAPLSGANVKIDNMSSVTDVNGEASISGSFDDDVDVSVSLQGYLSQTKKARIARVARYSGGTARMNFVLEKAESPSMPIRLLFEVLDAATNKPVDKASVYVRYHSKLVGFADTETNGEAKIEIKDSDDAPLTKLREGLNAYVYQTGYEEKLTDITTDSLKPSDEFRRLTIYLNPSFKALDEALKILEAKAAALNNDRQLVATAAREGHAAENAATSSVKRAEAIVAAIKESQAALGFAVGPGVSATKMRCDKAKSLIESIDKALEKASQMEKDLAKKLDDAQKLSFVCTSTNDAETIKTAYQEAIKLMASIGSLEKATIKDGDELSKLAEEAKGLANVITEAEKKLTEFDKEIRVVDDEFAKAQGALSRVMKLGQGLIARRDALRQELQKLKVTHDIVVARAKLPPPIQTRLANIESLLEARQPDIAIPIATKPDQGATNNITQSKSKIIELKNNAAGLIQQSKGLACVIEPSTKIADIGSLITSATIELSSSADLPNKAQDCAKLGTCKPLIDEIRVLLQQGAIDPAKTKIAAVRTQGCDVTQITNELDYWKTAREAVDFMDKLGAQCKFQEALTWAEKIPGGAKEKTIVKDAIAKLNTGLTAQKDTQSRLEKAKAAAAANNNTDVTRYVDEAQKIAQLYPCLLSEVDKFKKDQQNIATAEKRDPAAPVWAGVFYHQMMAGETTITVSLAGGALTAHEVWNDRGNSGTTTWSNCKVDGKTAKCDWTGTFVGKDKTGTRKGKLEASVGETSMSATYHEDEPNFTWKVKPYESAMRKGAIWPSSWMRKK